MPKGNRGKGTKTVGASVALFIFSCLLVGIYDSGRKHGEAIGEYVANTDTYARETQEHIEKCLTLPEDGTKTECIVREIGASNEHERAEKDLIAQTEMALWAFWMLVVSASMLVITAFGVWCLVDQRHPH
jgi:hypothetical protein